MCLGRQRRRQAAHVPYGQRLERRHGACTRAGRRLGVNDARRRGQRDEDKHCRCNRCIPESHSVLTYDSNRLEVARRELRSVAHVVLRGREQVVQRLVAAVVEVGARASDEVQGGRIELAGLVGVGLAVHVVAEVVRGERTSMATRASNIGRCEELRPAPHLRIARGAPASAAASTTGCTPSTLRVRRS